MSEDKKLPRNPSFTPCPGLRNDLEDHRDALGVTGRLNQVWDRYEAMIKQESLPLTEDEEFVLKQAMMGSYVEPLLIRYLEAEIQDCDAYLAGSAAAKSLAEKLESASYAQKLATVEKAGF